MNECVQGGVNVNIGFCMCICLVPILWLVAALLAVLKEKGAWLMAGFNTLPAQEQERYDRRRIARDASRQFFYWGFLFLAGAGLCLCVSAYVAIPVYGVWIVLYFKNLHLTAEKAFEKYRL